jgi:hypothetical protein
MAEGKQAWRNSQPAEWTAEVNRFFAALTKFDSYLAGDQPLHAPADKLFQGPFADALTRVGQLNMLRGMAALRSTAKTTTSPTSPPAAAAPTSRLRAANATESMLFTYPSSQKLIGLA